MSNYNAQNHITERKKLTKPGVMIHNPKFAENETKAKRQIDLKEYVGRRPKAPIG